MPVLVGYGDRLIRSDGSTSSLARSSSPLDVFGDQVGVRLIGPDGAGYSTSYDNVYQTQSLVYTAVNKLARILSTLPLKVYARDANGDKQRVLDGPLPELLRSPFPRASTFDLLESVVLSLLIYGNALVYKSRPAVGATPEALIPLDWRYVKPHSYVHGAPVEIWETCQTGEPVFLSPEDVMHVAWRAPGRSLGVSPLRPLATALALEDAARRFSTASFSNAARPGAAYILPSDTRLNKEDREELRNGINRTHSGPDQAFKTAIIQGGGQFVPLSHNAAESELVALRQRNREEVGAAFDLPGPLIGDLTHGTYSNVQELHRMLYETILLPWTVMVEQKFWAQLIARETAFAGFFAEFDFSERLRGDRQRELEVLTAASGGPIMVRNEARRAINLPRIDDSEADRLLTATNNMTPVGSTDVVKAHVDRAVHLFKRRAGAGHDKPWDRERFVRELEADAPDVDGSEVADALERLLITA